MQATVYCSRSNDCTTAQYYCDPGYSACHPCSKICLPFETIDCKHFCPDFPFELYTTAGNIKPFDTSTLKTALAQRSTTTSVHTITLIIVIAILILVVCALLAIMVYIRYKLNHNPRQAIMQELSAEDIYAIANEPGASARLSGIEIETALDEKDETKENIAPLLQKSDLTHADSRRRSRLGSKSSRSSYEDENQSHVKGKKKRPTSSISIGTLTDISMPVAPNPTQSHNDDNFQGTNSKKEEAKSVAKPLLSSVEDKAQAAALDKAPTTKRQLSDEFANMQFRPKPRPKLPSREHQLHLDMFSLELEPEDKEPFQMADNRRRKRAVPMPAQGDKGASAQRPRLNAQTHGAIPRTPRESAQVHTTRPSQESLETSNIQNKHFNAHAPSTQAPGSQTQVLNQQGTQSQMSRLHATEPQHGQMADSNDKSKADPHALNEALAQIKIRSKKPVRQKNAELADNTEIKTTAPSHSLAEVNVPSNSDSLLSPPMHNEEPGSQRNDPDSKPSAIQTKPDVPDGAHSKSTFAENQFSNRSRASLNTSGDLVTQQQDDLADNNNSINNITATAETSFNQRSLLAILPDRQSVQIGDSLRGQISEGSSQHTLSLRNQNDTKTSDNNRPANAALIEDPGTQNRLSIAEPTPQFLLSDIRGDSSDDNISIPPEQGASSAEDDMVHLNRVMELMKGPPWVMGYSYRRGEYIIKVTIASGKDPTWALQELVQITGEPAKRFHVKTEDEVND